MRFASALSVRASARRSRRRLSSEPARNDRRGARHRGDRRRVVIVLAGLRRAGRRRSVRADRTEGARHRRRLHLRRQTSRSVSRASAMSCASSRQLRRTVVVPYLEPATPSAPECSIAWDEFMARRLRSTTAVRAVSVQSSALHPVFVRHDRRAEVHRARRRRHTAPASEGASAALRHPRRRSRLLFHDVRLDDVELARDCAGLERNAGALRRVTVPSRWQHALRPGGRGGRDALRHVGEVHRRGRPRPACRRCPRIGCDSVRTITSTGSPLAPESFDFVYEQDQDATCIWRRSPAAPISSDSSPVAIRTARSGAVRFRRGPSG